MHLLLPRAVIQWLDAVRGTKSRQAYIVSILVKLAEQHEAK